MRRQVLLFVLSLIAAVASASPVVLEKGKGVTFKMNDRINLPTYYWPQTLLNYDVQFPGGLASKDGLVLTDKSTGESVPYQLSDCVMKSGKIEKAKVSFMASMPVGGSFEYVLKYGSGQASDSGVCVKEAAGKVIADNGMISLEIPLVMKDITILPDIKIHDSISDICGTMSLDVGKRTVNSYDVTCVERGPLFVRYKVDYVFDKGASYSMEFTLVRDYQFVIMEEAMKGFSEEDSVKMELTWDNYVPKWRYATMWDRTVQNGHRWHPIDKPIYTSFSKEDPFWSGQGILEDPSKKMLFRLTPFGGNSVREQTPLISFWGDSGRELGTFVYDHEKWTNARYDIWQQGPELSVYFRYDGKLHYMYPVVSGSRSTALAIYDRILGEAECIDFGLALDALGGRIKPKDLSFRYSSMLHSWFGCLNLDKVKDWKLDYSEKSERGKFKFASATPFPDVRRFLKEMNTSAMGYYMMGLNYFPGVHSIEHRNYYGKLVQSYLDFYYEMTDEEKTRVEALLLMAGYVNMTEAMNAIRTCLAGTANMAADGWAVCGINAGLFPEHPMRDVWMKYFEKSIEIYGLFYTRPEVKAYESLGGRWVESLGIYNWAYFKPTIIANTAMAVQHDRNAFANEHMVDRGRWMVDMLTAPVMIKRKHETEESLQRVYTAHGAHSGGRFVEQFAAVYQVGKFLENYDPIVSENLYWCGKIGVCQEGKKGDSDWDSVFASKYDVSNIGTNPHLRSRKYTGHGIVLRSGVDTPEEMSVHLDQVDKGPNYRWGNQAEGNSGGIYFYAGGRIWSGHENESAGDHAQNDVDNVCNFGVMKDGRFQTVGYNELVCPLHDLGVAQMATVCSVPEPGVSSWPEYESRSVMLIGTDYFMIFDKSGTNWRANNRFSWFVHEEDRLPNIVFFGPMARRDHWTASRTFASKGFYRDSNGSLLTLVTHKDNIRPLGGTLVRPAIFNAEEPIFEFKPSRSQEQLTGVYEIQTSGGTDIIFRDANEIDCRKKMYSFNGTAGVARKRNEGHIQLALFEGKNISLGRFFITLDAEKDCAVAMTFTGPSAAHGKFNNYGKASVKVGGISGGQFYIDGVRVSDASGVINLPEGEHSLEYTAGDAVPLPSEICATEDVKGGTMVWIERPASVSEVMVEISSDGGREWSELGKTSDEMYLVNVKEHGKYHLRAVSLNHDVRADFAQEYPIYVNNKIPHAPEGLRLRLDGDKVCLSWGKVLGVNNYRLYRKARAEKDWTVVYEGASNNFEDTITGVGKCLPMPSDDPETYLEPGEYQYYVVAVNGRGQSEASVAVDTSPSSWANWYPDVELKFNRQSAFWKPPYVYSYQVPDMYYPN